MSKPKSRFVYGLAICIVFLVSFRILKSVNIKLYNNVVYIALAIVLAPYAYKLFEKFKII